MPVHEVLSAQGLAGSELLRGCRAEIGRNFLPWKSCDRRGEEMNHEVKFIFCSTNEEKYRTAFELEIAEALDDGFELRGFQATDTYLGDNFESATNSATYGCAYALMIKAKKE
jgi:hypothetical protein